MKARTVKIFLVDGVPSGVMTAEIVNWTGQVTVCPRSQLADLALRNEVKRTGIYILVGENPDNPAQELVYLGESENVWKRLAQHNIDTDKDFWRRTVVVTSKDDNLTKGKELLNGGKLAQSPNAEYWVFTQSVPFTSPSTAASIVSGRRLNRTRIKLWLQSPRSE